MLTIITNNVPRFILCGYELPEDQRKEFDYLSDEEYPCHNFFKYKGEYYDLEEFFYTEKILDGHEISPIKQWDAYIADSFFSGIVVRFVKDSDDEIIVGRYYR